MEELKNTNLGEELGANTTTEWDKMVAEVEEEKAAEENRQEGDEINGFGEAVETTQESNEDQDKGEIIVTEDAKRSVESALFLSRHRLKEGQKLYIDTLDEERRKAVVSDMEMGAEIERQRMAAPLAEWDEWNGRSDKWTGEMIEKYAKEEGGLEALRFVLSNGRMMLNAQSLAGELQKRNVGALLDNFGQFTQMCGGAQEAVNTLEQAYQESMKWKFREAKFQHDDYAKLLGVVRESGANLSESMTQEAIKNGAIDAVQKFYGENVAEFTELARRTFSEMSLEEKARIPDQAEVWAGAGISMTELADELLMQEEPACEAILRNSEKMVAFGVDIGRVENLQELLDWRYSEEYDGKLVSRENMSEEANRESEAFIRAVAAEMSPEYVKKITREFSAENWAEIPEGEELSEEERNRRVSAAQELLEVIRWKYGIVSPIELKFAKRGDLPLIAGGCHSQRYVPADDSRAEVMQAEVRKVGLNPEWGTASEIQIREEQLYGKGAELVRTIAHEAAHAAQGEQRYLYQIGYYEVPAELRAETPFRDTPELAKAYAANERDYRMPSSDLAYFEEILEVEAFLIGNTVAARMEEQG